MEEKTRPKYLVKILKALKSPAELPSIFIIRMQVCGNYLQNWAGNQILLEECPGRHVVLEACSQVGEDGLHGVAGLLARDPQILLQWSRHPGEDGLGRLVGVQGAAWG